MAWADVESAIEPGTRLVIDTSAILAYLDGSERVSDVAAGVFDRLVAAGLNPAVVSAISVTEALVRPMRGGSAGAVATVEAFLLRFPNLAIQPVTYAIAREAATIRAATALPAPDATILGTAVVAGDATVIANDARWSAAIERAGLRVRLVHLDAFV
jgi:predicted nucleic acid-binding protein